MKMDVCMKKGFQFSRFTGILLPAGNEMHYIGGAEVLPAPLSPEEEKVQIDKLREGEDQDARAALIEHNLRLVVYIAKKFDNTGVGVEDLISIGTIGLIKAINTFDPVKKIKLATYASRCIENEILMYLRRNSKTKLEVSIDEPLNVDWDKVLLIPVSITYDSSTSSSGNKTITGIQNDLKPGYAKLKGGPKENAKGEVESPLKIEVTYTSFNK